MFTENLRLDRSGLRPDQRAAFNHLPNITYGTYIGQWITFNDYHVRHQTRNDTAYLVSHANRLGGFARRCA
jgi:hypothetical protein